MLFSVPLIVLTLGTLCLHWYMDTRGLQSSLGGLDVAGGLKFVQKVMKISKAAAVMEFTVVSVVRVTSIWSCYRSYSALVHSS